MPQLTGVRERRQRTGIKAGVFANLVGLKLQSFGNVEAGRRPASIEAAHRIANKLTELGVPTVVSDIVVAEEPAVPDRPPLQPKREPSRPPGREDQEGQRKGPRRVGNQVPA